MIIGIIVSIIAFVCCPDPFISFIEDVVCFISSNIYFVIPIICGFFVGRYIFQHYLLKFVFLIVEPLDSPSYFLKMSCSTFESYNKVNGLINPESTRHGEVMYRVKSLDEKTRTIDGGWIHEKDTSPSMIFTQKSMYYKWMADFRKANVRIVELTDNPFTEGMGVGVKVVNHGLDLMSRVAFGDSGKPVSQPVSPSPDQSVSSDSSDKKEGDSS